LLPLMLPLMLPLILLSQALAVTELLPYCSSSA
jgi:hypothetical protein